MTLNEVQKSIEDQLRNSRWFHYPAQRNIDIVHAVTGLNEEAGEVAGLLKKQIFRGKEKSDEQWLSELGDVLWYLTAVTVTKGLTLEDVWKYNCSKLEDRRERGFKNHESWEG